MLVFFIAFVLDSKLYITDFLRLSCAECVWTGVQG